MKLFLYLATLFLLASCNDDDSTTAAAASSKYIFSSATKTNGNIGGITGADALCNADANKPNASTYKALIVDGTNRTCGAADDCTGGTDWPLKANTTYVRKSDGATFAVTDVNKVFYTFDTNQLNDGTASLSWAGISGNYTDHANNCNNWTSSSNGVTGAIGDGNWYDITFLATGGSDTCDQTNSVICVEQQRLQT